MIDALILAVLGAPESNVNPIETYTQPTRVIRGEKEYDGRSLYRGEHFSPQHEDERRCIRDRESNNKYGAVNATGKYRGAYQFSPELAVGAGWMIQKDLKENGVPHSEAKAVGQELRATSINQWNPYFQDYAFWVIWDHGKGKNHWKHQVPGTACF